MGALDRKGSDGMPSYPIVSTCEGHLFAFEQTLDDGHRFGQPLDPGAPSIEAQARLVIFRLDAARAQTELQPSVRQEVDCRSFTRDQHGMAEIIVEHVAADP